jgi:hypothetical protein
MGNHVVNETAISRHGRDKNRVRRAGKRLVGNGQSL